MASGANGGPIQANSKDFDRLFGGANPNPDRIGCPPSEVLRALAARQRPIGDPAFEHLAQCSPCYRDFRHFQTAAARGSAHPKAYFATAAAVVVLLLGVGGYLISSKAVRPQSDRVRATENTVLPTVKLLTADLRNASPTRSSTAPPQAPKVKLSRDLVQLTIILPIGSEPGRYNIRLLRSSGEVVSAADARASIVNFATTLTATLDLRALQAAVYELEVERVGEHADGYAVRVE